MQLLHLKVCESFRFGQIKKLEVYFGMCESSFTFIETKRPNKHCLREADLISLHNQFRMLVLFLPIFVVDTKIIFRYDFVAPLMTF